MSEESEDTNRIPLIIDTFNNIGEILYFEESRAVVMDPRRFTEKLVQDIVDHNIIEQDGSTNKGPQQIQDALRRGLLVTQEGKDEDDDLVQDAIQSIQDRNKEKLKKQTEDIVEEEMKSLLSRGLPHQQIYLERVEHQSISLLKRTDIGAQLTFMAIFIQAIQSGLKKDRFPEKENLQAIVNEGTKNLLSSGLYFHQIEPESREEQEQYLKLLEAAGIGVRLTPLALFVPLLISESNGSKIVEAAKEFKRNGKCKVSVRYKLKNIAGNGNDFFHKFTSIVVKEFKMEVCFSRKIEKRSGNCLVTSIVGTTGTMTEETCLVCQEIDSQPKLWCSECQKSRVHIHCAHGVQECVNCRKVLTKKKSPQETEFLYCQYQKCEASECRNSLVIDFSNDDDEELVKALNDFDQRVEDAVRAMRGFVTRHVGCSRCKKQRGNFLDSNIDDFCNYQSLETLKASDLYCKDCQNEMIKSKIFVSIEECGNFRDFEMYRTGKEVATFMNESLLIKKSGDCEGFAFRGRLARFLDFDKVTSHLRTEEKILVIGPMLEMGKS